MYEKENILWFERFRLLCGFMYRGRSCDLRVSGGKNAGVKGEDVLKMSTSSD